MAQVGANVHQGANEPFAPFAREVIVCLLLLLPYRGQLTVVEARYMKPSVATHLSTRLSCRF